MNNDLITIAQVIGLLDVSSPTIYRRIKEQNVPIFKIGKRALIKKTDVEKLISVQVKNVLEQIQSDNFLQSFKTQGGRQ